MDSLGSVCFFVIIVGTCIIVVNASDIDWFVVCNVVVVEYQFGLVGDGVVVLVPGMEQFDLIQGPIVSNFRINVGTNAVAVVTFIAVLVFKGITIAVTSNVITIIIIISCIDEKDIKGGVWSWSKKLIYCDPQFYFGSNQKIVFRRQMGSEELTMMEASNSNNNDSNGEIVVILVYMGCISF
jgi:hypothetical protein